MSISVQELFDQASSDFGVSASSSRFVAKFFRAINQVTRDINDLVGEDEDDVDALSDEISLDTSYWITYADGIRYYMQRGGEFGIQPDPQAKLDYYRSLGHAQSYYLTENDPYVRDETEDDDDDSESL